MSSRESNDILLVPIDLCFYAVQNRCIRMVQVYVHLKSISSGKVRLDNSELKKIVKELGIRSTKTLKKWLEELITLNWVGHNRKSGVYFIRGFENIRAINEFDRTISAVFNNPITQFRPFVVGAVIGYLAHYQFRKKEFVRKRRRTNQNSNDSKRYQPVATIALAKILGVSLRTAHQYKQLAFKAGFIDLKKNFEAAGSFKVNEVDLLRKYSHSKEANAVRVVGNNLVKFKPDLIASNIRFKQRKKSKTYKRRPTRV